ncbi:hypothetical protein SASPL_118209 [Salvia splendens]|uniref:V-ATPase proteolipid subunit C-like domain-containing protein n=1 Tax=Salvia splendens TaxID=180675 RepID=A0A8X8ZX13_SALSN|nr:hypothetical protein SASPL_118209 [Salvia splendens]
MSLSSCSDCFSDLLCGEASSSIIFSGGGYFSLEYSSNFDSQASDAAEYISRLLANERDLPGISICCTVDEPIDASVIALSSSEIINQSDPRSPQKRAGWSQAFREMVTSSSSWVRALLQISPYTFSAIGIAISIGVSVLGAAWYFSHIGNIYNIGIAISIGVSVLGASWGIYITGSSLIGAAIKSSRINSKNLIRNMKSESSSDQIRRISRIVVANRRGVIMNDLVEIVNRVGV